MSPWDIFRWRTLAGGPPCRQRRQRFSHRAPPVTPPQACTALWYKRRRGDTGVCGALAGCPPVGGGEGSGKPPSWCVTVREKRCAVSLAFFCALRAYKGKVETFL